LVGAFATRLPTTQITCFVRIAPVALPDVFGAVSGFGRVDDDLHVLVGHFVSVRLSPAHYGGLAIAFGTLVANLMAEVDQSLIAELVRDALLVQCAEEVVVWVRVSDAATERQRKERRRDRSPHASDCASCGLPLRLYHDGAWPDLHNGTLITVFGKSNFTTPFALRCCVIWAFNARHERKPIDAAALN
jgi:hypothetical protein